jgi:hypothetical protein
MPLVCKVREGSPRLERAVGFLVSGTEYPVSLKLPNDVIHPGGLASANEWPRRVDSHANGGCSYVARLASMHSHIYLGRDCG